MIMGFSVVVDSANFAVEVVQKSYEKPVLVDFFAQWCGPCQMLKPILEKLTQEYDFVLAKVDIDQNPELANAYGIEGVPDVRVVSHGEISNGFVGMLPEAQIRELLAQLGLKSELELGLEEVREAIAASNPAQAKQQFDQLFQKYPEDRKLILEAAKFLLSLNQLESAQKMLATIQEHEKEFFAEAQALKAMIQFQQESNNPVIESELDQQFLDASKLTLEQNYEAALQGFLAIVGKNRKYKNDGARKAMVAIFDLLGDEHPLTKDYRKQLMLTLY
jgi:putative thioredoxin